MQQRRRRNDWFNKLNTWHRIGGICIAIVVVLTAVWKLNRPVFAITHEKYVKQVVEEELDPIIVQLKRIADGIDRVVETTDWQTFVQVETTAPDSLEALAAKWKRIRNGVEK